MKKHLLLALFSLMFPLVAGAITPKVGHYEGTAVDHHHIVHRHISFDVTFSDQHYFIKHLHLPPNIFHYTHGRVGGFWHTHRTFKFEMWDVVAITFKGHGEFESDTRIVGDFREHPAFSPFNTYYTWHANWKHD